MLIKEYRIPLPLTVEEYRIAQLFMIAVSFNQIPYIDFKFYFLLFPYVTRKKVAKKVKVKEVGLKLS